MTPEEYVKACEQPVAILTAVMLIVTISLHMIGMFTIFIKIDQLFNPSRIMARQRDQRYWKNIK